VGAARTLGIEPNHPTRGGFPAGRVLGCPADATL